MTRDQLKSALLQELQRLAPEADLAALSSTARLREELDLDSFDFARFIAALHERLHIDVPESAYGKLETLDGCLEYLLPRSSGA